MKNIILKGPLLTNSGYGVHSRQVFLSLLNRKNINLFVQPTLWGNTSWILSSKYEQEIIDKIVKLSHKKKNDIEFEESYQVLLPTEWSNLANINVGITAGFEANIVKKEWLYYVNTMDHVLVPSEYSRNAFLKTSIENNIKLKTEIKVINEYYFRSFSKIKNCNLLDKDFEFNNNILIIGQITSNNQISDRKNIIKTIKTALEYVKNKKIGIVLKINTGKYSTQHKEKLIEILESNLHDYNLDKLTILFGNLEIDQIKSLYTSKKISCLLSGTRAEGWGLSFVEASACGLPIIATNYSAYTEYLCNDFLGIDYDLTIFNHDKQFTDYDAKPLWAEFCQDSMLKCLNMFFDNKEKYIEIARKRKRLIKQNYCYDKINKDYIEFFESI